MASETDEKLSSKCQIAKEQGFCPECGSRMAEADRRFEKGVMFIWYRCAQKNCDGQWLRKMVY